MNDPECVALLQWALPTIGLRWRGFKNVRRQVCRRLIARVHELGLDAASYRKRLEEDPNERKVLDALCYVTISRFYRDRQIIGALRETLIPELLRSSTDRTDRTLRVWSAGCASGEEPYTIAMMWELSLAKSFPDWRIEIIATDTNDEVLARARRGAYESSCLVELPPGWRDQAFEELQKHAHEAQQREEAKQREHFVIREAVKRHVTFLHEDIRLYTPDAPLHLVLCRNLAFTYFDETNQRAFIDRIATRLVARGLLVVGGHETVPSHPLLEPHPTTDHVFVRAL